MHSRYDDSISKSMCNARAIIRCPTNGPPHWGRTLETATRETQKCGFSKDNVSLWTKTAFLLRTIVTKDSGTRSYNFQRSCWTPRLRLRVVATDVALGPVDSSWRQRAQVYESYPSPLKSRSHFPIDFFFKKPRKMGPTFEGARVWSPKLLEYGHHLLFL